MSLYTDLRHLCISYSNATGADVGYVYIAPDIMRQAIDEEHSFRAGWPLVPERIGDDDVIVAGGITFISNPRIPPGTMYASSDPLE